MSPPDIYYLSKTLSELLNLWINDVLEQRVYHGRSRFASTAELKRVLREEWDAFPLEIIDSGVEGGHIEQFFWEFVIFRVRIDEIITMNDAICSLAKT